MTQFVDDAIDFIFMKNLLSSNNYDTRYLNHMILISANVVLIILSTIRMQDKSSYVTFINYVYDTKRRT
jgi:hypothetical protein